MSWDWNDRDLLDWAKKTLPEFVLASMQDPSDKRKAFARTPWECFEIKVAEVQIDGEVTLTGKKSQAVLMFDLDIGMRIHIEKNIGRGSESQADDLRNFWPAIVQIMHFEKDNMRPSLITKLDDTDEEVAQEVEWYLKEGMGKHYLWHALARWHAYAIKKWCKVEPDEIEDPYSNPLRPPSFPPFKAEELRRQAEDVARESALRERGLLGPAKNHSLKGVSEAEHRESEKLLAKSLAKEVQKNQDLQVEEAFDGTDINAWLELADQASSVGKKDVGDPGAYYESPPCSDDEDEDEGEGEWELDKHTMQFRRKGVTPNMKKFEKYPFLPSMLCGVGGPSMDWLPPKEHAIGHPEWQASIDTREKGRITAIDMILDESRKKREELENLANGKQVTMRALELCQAIEKNDLWNALSKLDEQTASCPHPETGRCAAHYCVDQGNVELLQMVVDARADLNLKDAFGQTALMMTARRSDSALARILLDGGADATEEDALGRSAADMVKIVPIEEDHPLKNWREKMTGDAIPEDPAKKAQDLKAMIDDKERPKKYGTMLLGALVQRDVRTAESSIENGADVNLLDEKGDSPVMLLAKGKWKDTEGLQIRLLEKLHKAGSNVNFQNSGGNTPLLYAAHRGNHRLAESLLKANADPAVTNSEGNTPLMYAAHGGHEALCTQLLEAFAAPSAKNKFGLTAEQMAQKKGFGNCAVLIHAYEMCPKKPGIDEEPKKKEKRNKPTRAFDYSKWDALEKEMEEDERIEENTRIREAQQANKQPRPKIEDMGPEAFGLPADTPWPPAGPSSKSKGPFDYSRWNKIVDDVERKDAVMERYEYLQQNPQYEWKDGEKRRVIFG